MKVISCDLFVLTNMNMLYVNLRTICNLSIIIKVEFQYKSPVIKILFFTHDIVYTDNFFQFQVGVYVEDENVVT